MSKVVDIEAEVGRASALLAAEAVRKAIEIRTNFAPDAPRQIEGDASKLGHVLYNFLENAIRFSPEGRPVDVRVEKENDQRVKILVCDEGPGVPTEIQDRIRKGERAGQGMGLWVAKKLADFMGAELEFESQPGHTSFWIALGPKETSKRILLAEDSTVARQLIARQLKSLGYAVDEAKDGEEAITLFTPGKYCAVLLDCQMPGLDGFATLAALRKKKGGAHLPVIAISAFANQAEKDRILASGADACLVKPFSLEALDAVIKNWTQEGMAEIPVQEKETALAEAIVDEDALAEARELMGDEFPNLVASFLNESQEGMERIKKALLGNDHEQVRFWAHRLKSSAKSMGAANLCTLLAHLEAAARQPVHDHTRLLFQEVEEAFSQAQERLRLCLPQGTENKGEAASKASAKVLVVDDDGFIRRLMERHLAKADFVVKSAPDGQTALEIAAEFRPQLALVDVIMPGMDGFEVCRRLKDMQGDEVDVVLVTSLDDAESAARAIAVGAADFVHKPFHFPVLFERLRWILGKREAERALARLTFYDPATGLPNRSLLLSRMREAMAEGGDLAMGVLGFVFPQAREVSRALAHVGEDMVARILAQRLAMMAPSGSTLAAMANGEFAIFISRLEDANDAAAVAQDILRAMEEGIEIAGERYLMRVSIGISLYPLDSDDPETLLSRALLAAQRGEGETASDFRFYTPAVDEEIRARLRLERDLAKAIEAGHLLLHYQPILDLSRGAILGFEALVRWKDRERGMISPGAFIPTAERSGLIGALGAWVLQRAAQDGVAWRSMGFSPRVSVNVSVPQLMAQDFAARVKEILDRARALPEMMEIEVTESIFAEDMSLVVRVLDDIRAFGVSIAIDDFGTGYSNFAALKQLPVQKIKVDQSIIRQIESDGDVRAIARAARELGRAFDVEMLAEGVEKASQVAVLRELDYALMQGFYFARPVPFDAATELLRRGGVPWSGSGQ